MKITEAHSLQSTTPRLGLGTVQFGCDYGVSNKYGRVCIDEIEKILKYSRNVGMEIIDTAQGYGTSEDVLGKFNLVGFKINTKIIGNGKLETSLEKLKQEKIYGLLFHRANEVDDKNWKKFEEYKKRGLVEKIGVSVYTPKELEEIISKYPIDLVQLPVNILDQRFLPFLKTLRELKIEIHARSVFLQGLLLMDVEEINDFFNPIKPILGKLPKNRLGTAIGFVSSIREIDKIIVGTTSLTQLKEIVQAFGEKMVPENPEKFKVDSERFILPQNWKIK